jgi:hypothetical protein
VNRSAVAGVGQHSADGRHAIVGELVVGDGTEHDERRVRGDSAETGWQCLGGVTGGEFRRVVDGQFQCGS